MAAAALFSTASSLFGGSALAKNYSIAEGGPGRAVIGLWMVQKATSKNGKAVSIWTLDKASLSGTSKARSTSALAGTVEVLKKEVSMLSRLRHPCVLEVVEPLEETRSQLTFATEQVTSSLTQAIQASGGTFRTRRNSTNDENDLDEIEIQKGLLQVGKALQFLHESARLVHSNLTPDAIIINAKGDWKLSGFGLSTFLSSADGQAARWEFPQADRSLPQSVQKNFDYLAPEFALDETLAPSNDMYALGCIIYAIHAKSGPPLHNHNSLQSLRENMETLGSIRASWHRLGDEVQDVLSQLLTRYPSTRLSASTFQSSRYFSSILVSTLRFLDRDSFAAKPREEQASFLKGLLKVLPQFSDKVIKRKILPSLLEETRKNMLVPFLLPCIFYIGEKMDNAEFAEAILPAIKPLFAMKDPPQAMLALLDHLTLFHKKCSATLFREEVLPLIYNALESDVPPILEKALKVIPSLSESLDYTTVKSLLLPKITAVFSKTTSLSVKVTTLLCFKSLVPVLDKFTLTEKLVPLLSRIKTKEPSVMVATLAVHEQIGLKCDIQAIATLVLPQLWAMSITPLLSAEQFRKFMMVIKQLGTRVEEEHSQHLAEIKRLEQSSGGHRRVSTVDANGDGEVDFEALVRGDSSTGSNGAPGTPDPFGVTDDLSKFGSMSMSSPPPSSFSPPPMASAASRAGAPSGSQAAPTQSLKAATVLGARPNLGARPISASAYQARSGLAVTPDSSGPPTPTAISHLPPPMSASPAISRTSSHVSAPINASSSQYNGLLAPQAAPSNYFGSNIPSSSISPMSSYMQPLQPTSSSLASHMSPLQPHAATPIPTSTIQWGKPASAAPAAPQTQQALSPTPIQWSQPIKPVTSPPPGWNSAAILQPTKKENAFGDWSDFDPMR